MYNKVQETIHVKSFVTVVLYVTDKCSICVNRISGHTLYKHSYLPLAWKSTNLSDLLYFLAIQNILIKMCTKYPEATPNIKKFNVILIGGI